MIVARYSLSFHCQRNSVYECILFCTTLCRSKKFTTILHFPVQSKAVDEIIINEDTCRNWYMYMDNPSDFTEHKEYTPLVIACMYVPAFFTFLRDFSRLFFSFFSIFPSIFASSFFLYVTWLFNLFLSSSVILRLFVILIKENGLCLNITSLM